MMASNPPVTRLSIPSVPEFTVWMMVEGIQAPLYSVQESPNKTICYVESKTGQHFAIGFSDSRQTRPYGYSADLYGIKSHLRGYPIPSDRLYPSETISATRVTSTTERPFVFGEVSTTSDDQLACTDETIFKNLGSLSFKIRRWSSRKPRRGIPGQKQKSLDSPLIHEDSKKANFSHTTSFGVEQAARIRKKPRHFYRYIDLPGQPFHTFEFRYRSRAILEMENLIPEAIDTPQALPVAGPSHSRLSNASSASHSRSKSASNPLPQAPIIISDDEEEPVSEAELSRLQDELAELERQSRMAAIKRRIRGESATSAVKREGEEEGVGVMKGKKKVKLEKGGNGAASGGKEKGKEKEVIVLSDSD